MYLPWPSTVYAQPKCILLQHVKIVVHAWVCSDLFAGAREHDSSKQSWLVLIRSIAYLAIRCDAISKYYSIFDRLANVRHIDLKVQLFGRGGISWRSEINYWLLSDQYITVFAHLPSVAIYLVLYCEIE